MLKCMQNEFTFCLKFKYGRCLLALGIVLLISFIWCCFILQDSNWTLVAAEFIGGVVSAVTLWVVTITLPNKKEKKDQKAKILAGLAVFEQSRRTLLWFNYNYILQRAKDATRLTHYIEHFEKIKADGNSQTLANSINADTILNSKNDTVDINLIKGFCHYLQSLSVEDMRSLLDKILQHFPLFSTTLYTSYPEKPILTQDLTEKLSFVANYNPGILIGMEQATGDLLELNLVIRYWNEHVQEHKKNIVQNALTHQVLATHISCFLELSYQLYNKIEDSLMSIWISMDHLQEYAYAHYPDKESFNLYGKADSEVEPLMPKELDAYSQRKKQNLDSMKIK